MKYNQQRGVALVITLIMLSVITFLAVAFLALTRRDKSAVNTSLSQTDARFMADTALARAEAEMVSRMIARSNLLDYNLTVTRNYINAGGFTEDSTNLLNVNYDYKDTGDTKFSADDRVVNLGNLFYDPRPPVYIRTNGNTNLPLDFRFYVDINQDGAFNTNGLVPVIGEDGLQIGTEMTLTVGDPEWVGILEKPQYPHSGTNRFIGRYAFAAIPEGKTLDVNFMGNYTKGNFDPAGVYTDIMPTNGFLRNGGVGSWEINLAAFFQDLNTNMYPVPLDPAYEYMTNAQIHKGNAFTDAHDVLRYRYRTNHNSLLSATATLGVRAATLFTNDLIDAYADGPLLHTNSSLRADNDDPSKPWPGSKNPQSFRDIQELLQVTKVSPGMVNRLRGSTTNVSSYNRQTFTRLLSQLGTSSDTNNIYVVDGRTYPKIHLNYDNVKITNGVRSQTNFLEWEPLNFFTNTAEALIRKSLIRTNAAFHYLGGRVDTNFSINSIMVYPTNEYSPAVHRLLQLSANIYAATANGYTDFAKGVTNPLPFVFRPKIERRAGTTNLFIVGYEEITNSLIGSFFDAANVLSPTNSASLPTNYNVYGIPWVISAKKGLPNFNEFSFALDGELTRKIEVTKPTINALPNATNLLYQFSLINRVGVEFWNSYTQAFRNADIRLNNIYTGTITNVAPSPPLSININTFGQNSTNTNFVVWSPAATNGAGLLPSSFKAFRYTNAFLPSSQYTNHPDAPFFQALGTNIAKFEVGRGFYVPNWHLSLTNRLVAAIIETKSDRIIDLVSFDRLQTETNIWDLVLANYNSSGPGSDQGPTRFWNTNSFKGTLTKGMDYQLQVAKGAPEPTWKDRDENAVQAFRFFLGLTPTPPPNYTPRLRMDSPFNPTWRGGITNSWQANDPLVHYMAQDLVVSSTEKESIGGLNGRYSPWGGPRVPGFGDPLTTRPTDYEMGVKDPMVRWSDEWTFPTNKFPNIGALGRVHRGTPWQTVYMKADRGLPTNMWPQWSGNFDGSMHPTTDWHLLDIFTAAPNDNAARGLLSVNQTNLASWSAVLSGVTVVSNTTAPNRLAPSTTPGFTSLEIQPSSAQLSNIVYSINMARTNRPGGVFQSVGEVLSAPALTFGTTNVSPFLNLSDARHAQHGLTDAAVERIPQQILSLLKVGYPRISVYSYGQALRPAPNSIQFNPPSGRRDLQNICTNYQITGEVVTRTVLRVEGTAQNPKAIVESFQILQED